MDHALTYADNDQQRDGHDDGLDKVCRRCRQESAQCAVHNNYDRGNDHSFHIRYVKQ